MKYIVRINPKALDMLTKQVNEKVLWEVEQCEARGRANDHIDSEKVIWHCANVKIDDMSIEKYITEHKLPLKGLAVAVSGVAIRDASDAIKIITGPHDGSGW